MLLTSRPFPTGAEIHEVSTRHSLGFAETCHLLMMRFVTFTKAYQLENATTPLGPIDSRLCRFFLQPHIRPFYRMPENEVESFLLALANQCDMEPAQLASEITQSDPVNTTPNWFASATNPHPKLPKKIILRYLGIVRYIMEASNMPPKTLLAIIKNAPENDGTSLYRWCLQHTTMDYTGGLHAFQMTYSAYTKTRSQPTAKLPLLDNLALQLYNESGAAPPMAITPTRFVEWLGEVSQHTHQSPDVVATQLFGIQPPPAKRWANNESTPANNVLRFAAIMEQYARRVNTTHNTVPDLQTYYKTLVQTGIQVNAVQPNPRRKG